jgi:hypothetical protein
LRVSYEFELRQGWNRGRGKESEGIAGNVREEERIQQLIQTNDESKKIDETSWKIDEATRWIIVGKFEYGAAKVGTRHAVEELNEFNTRNSRISDTFRAFFCPFPAISLQFPSTPTRLQSPTLNAVTVFDSPFRDLINFYLHSIA